MRFNSFRSFLLVLINSVLLSTQAIGQHKSNYAIYDVKSKNIIDLQEIVAVVQPDNILVFGEQHGDSTAHALQYELVNLLYARIQDKLVISMEMFQTDVQHVLDEYLNGWISENNFIKESRAWANYKDYKPIVEFAKANELKIIAANTPSRYTNMVTREGFQALNNLPKNVRKQWLPPLPIDTLTGAYYANFLEVMGGHVMPSMKMYQSQNLWDATMSYNIHKAAKKNQNGVIFHLTGKFHSDYNLGTVYRLLHDYKKQVITISFCEIEDLNNINWKLFENIANYLIVKEKTQNEE